MRIINYFFSERTKTPFSESLILGNLPSSMAKFFLSLVIAYILTVSPLFMRKGVLSLCFLKSKNTVPSFNMLNISIESYLEFTNSFLPEGSTISIKYPAIISVVFLSIFKVALSSDHLITC
ncbi:hypothetical protein protein (plasmid) [Bacillus cereus G9241]|nr:hypothetical protein protein [Bacillus cereus G9241]